MAQSTGISSVANSTLNASVSTFSFQDALTFAGRATGSYSYYYLNPPVLFQNGCLQPNGSQNCTASCQDSNVVFGSLDTLHNCMVYPTVADLYARNNLSNTSLPEDNNIQKSKVNSTLYINITTTIQTCLIDFCTATPGCTSALNEYNEDYMMYSPSNLTSRFYLFTQAEGGYSFDVCQYVPGSFNPDIGGIGVRWVSVGVHEICVLTSG